MTRSAFAPAAALLCSLALASPSFAQAAKQTAPPAKPATATTTTPAAPAKFVTPVKGTAYIEVIRGDSKKVGNDMVTTVKVKNVSNGPIALLRMDETWYNKSRAPVTGDTAQSRQPLMPGQVIELTTKSPIKPDLYVSQFAFSHANGKIDAKAVKKFTEK